MVRSRKHGQGAPDMFLAYCLCSFFFIVGFLWVPRVSPTSLKHPGSCTGNANIACRFEWFIQCSGNWIQIHIHFNPEQDISDISLFYAFCSGVIVEKKNNSISMHFLN